MLGINVKIYADSYLDSSAYSITTFNPSGGSTSYWVSNYGSSYNYFYLDFNAPFCLTEYKCKNIAGSSAVSWYFTIYGSDDLSNWQIVSYDYINSSGNSSPSVTISVNNDHYFRYYKYIYSRYNNTWDTGRYILSNFSASGHYLLI